MIQKHDNEPRYTYTRYTPMKMKKRVTTCHRASTMCLPGSLLLLLISTQSYEGGVI